MFVECTQKENWAGERASKMHSIVETQFKWPRDESENWLLFAQMLILRTFDLFLIAAAHNCSSSTRKCLTY